MDLLLHNLRTIGTHHCDGSVGEEAAIEIERLRTENERLRHALHYVTNYPKVRQHIGTELSQLADAALAAKGGVE